MTETTEWRNRIVGEGEQPASQFIANPANWRTHPQNQRDAMRGALNEVGWVQRVVVNRQTGYLVDGHERVWQALQNGDAPVPYVEVDLSPEEEAYVLATLDPIGAMAAADKEQLDALLREVQSGEAGVQAMLADVAKEAGLYKADDDEGPSVDIDLANELREKWQTAAGQMWEVPSLKQAGRAHRLACADSTNAVDVAALFGPNIASLLVTDPPYNVGVGYGLSVNDSMPEEGYRTFSEGWFGAWRAHSKRQIVTPGCYNLARWLRWFDPYHVAPWIKTNSMTNGKVSRFWCWEPTLFFGEPDEWSWEPILFYGDGWQRKRANDVFNYPVGAQKDVANHPCPKPLAMWKNLLLQYSAAGDVIADAFMGSGTTMVAAEDVGRVCYGMEIEPKYVAVTLERMAGMGLEPRLAE